MAAAADALGRIVADLRSKSEDVQVKAAGELRSMVDAAAAEGGRLNLTRLSNDVNRRIFELVHSNDVNDKVGGILAIERLMDFEGEDNTTKITRFANYLRIVLTVNDAHVTLNASRALGRLALVGGTLTAEFVEFEVKRALEWLQGERYEQRRYAAVLVLGEFAANAPTLIYAYVPQIFELIGVPLRDIKVTIRESAAETLGACLRLVYQRESSSRAQWYRRLYDDAMRGLKVGTVESVHGSLLLLRELVPHTGTFLEGRFREIYDLSFQFREHKDALIRRIVVQLQPVLAEFAPEEYGREALAGTMAFFLQQMKREKERVLVLEATGKIALAVGAPFGPYLEAVVFNIREVLALTAGKAGLGLDGLGSSTSSGAGGKGAGATAGGAAAAGGADGPAGKPVHARDAAFRCLAMLAAAVGPALTKFVHELLDVLFATGISHALTEALRSLVQHIPALLPTIEERLLNILSVLLCGQPYRHPGAPVGSEETGGAWAGEPLGNPPAPSGQGGPVTAPTRDTATLILALNTLGTFGFSNTMLHELVRRCALIYLEDEHAEVRRAAAVTTCRLLARDPVIIQTSDHAILVVEQILEKLLVVGITDADASIRLTVLQNLEPKLDHHLAQADNVRSLFVALNDEMFAIREASITIIGRLTAYNPAYVMPSLRKTLIQLLTELEYSQVSRSKEEAARLLGRLVSSSRRLIKPYVEPILKVLLPKARDPSTEVVAQVMAAIGEVAEVGGEDMDAYLDDLFPLAIETLQDQSHPAKREAALYTMGHVARSTGYVIEPYLKYPKLLPLLVHILKSEQNVSIRRATLKLLGILGALDPYRNTVSLSGAMRRAAVTGPAGALGDAAGNVGPGGGPAAAIAAAQAAAAAANHAAAAATNAAKVGGGAVGALGAVGPANAVAAGAGAGAGAAGGVGDAGLGPAGTTALGLIGDGGKDAGTVAAAVAAAQAAAQAAANAAAAAAAAATAAAATAAGDGTAGDGGLGDGGESASTLPLSPSSDDYGATVAIQALMRILRDPSLSVHHMAVVQAVMYIFKTLGLKCVPFLRQITPPLLGMMRTCPASMLEFHFQQLGTLVAIVKQHIRPFLPELFALAQEHWNVNAPIQITILSLVEAIARALDGEFKMYLSTLLPQILLIFEQDVSERRLTTSKALHVLLVFGASLDEYLHLVVPAVVRLFERSDMPVATRRYAMQVVGQLSRTGVSFADQASRILHALVRVLQAPQVELRTTALDTVCTLVYHLGADFAIFVPMVNRVLARQRMSHAKYEMLVTRLLQGAPLPQEVGVAGLGDVGGTGGVGDGTAGAEEALAPAAESGSKKLPVNQAHLKRAWEASQRAARDDWYEWIRRFSVELVKESPSPALRACASLAGQYTPLARELFNAAFGSCWGELYDQFQDELIRSLVLALKSPSIPPEILQMLLNLAEFMEHDDKALPIDVATLGQHALKCHAYAKALHYREFEFAADPQGNVEALISINDQLQQLDSAVGILTYAQQQHNVALKESWYEKLQRWDDALVAYERKQREDPDNVEVLVGRMRCLNALGEWEALSSLARQAWPLLRVPTLPNVALPATTPATGDGEARKAIPALGAAAAWALGEWEQMDEYISAMKADSPDAAFFKSILAFHRGQFAQSLQFGARTRDLLDTELTALLGESYSRAYTIAVRVQMLAEMEEIIAYQQLYDDPERQALIRRTWMRRLEGCARTVETWQRVLKVRALVVSPREDMEMWIKFSNLCRKSGRLTLAHKTLSGLLGEAQDPWSLAEPPTLVYAMLKYHWAAGQQRRAFDHMKAFSASLLHKLGPGAANVTAPGTPVAQGQAGYVPASPARAADARQLARCYVKLGDWEAQLAEGLTVDNVSGVLRAYSAATHFGRDWYKAWHAWALANFEVVALGEKGWPASTAQSHIVPAIQGFSRSISLSHGNSLQDALRLLTLWFKYGYLAPANEAIAQGLECISIDTWLQVIPQLIARIHTPAAQVRQLIHTLLANVGREHPQALVYPLTVASKSQSAPRRAAALAILDTMRQHSARLVEQALVVSHELIRVAILWHEMWHEGLEEASRLYFGDRNVDAMFATLEPLHAMLERGPETLREVSFNQAFGRDLHEAQDWCRKYRRSQNVNDLNQAWDLYYHVFRKINKQLPQLTTLELQYVSPRLLAARDMELAVPGTYRAGVPAVRIQAFSPTLTVITSKQRPRKLAIRGSDGREYQYLLKGHEDLRQDERVMQLFDLCNTLLAADAETFKRHLSIQRYPVTPLSPNSGLIGWVPHCDTLHALIRDYRESRKILLNIEHRLMLQMAPDYDHLALLQKVEVFEYALQNTTGQDLYKVLWLKSKNSEVWLERRTNYTRSVAVMSMVGYILGLGDRHPSNLMLDRYSGRVLHIDFGDCFEVAMHREKFPERIPFRLTRMLINAMEVSGIEGNYRITCQQVMRVLRDNKDSLMAVLEAFVYDPLINWRLLTPGAGATAPAPAATADRGDADAPGAQPDAPAPRPDAEAGPSADPAAPASARVLPRSEADLLEPVDADDPYASKPEALNARAVAVIARVQNKLTGRDFKASQVLDVPSQVQRLVVQATSLENLCQCYIGWCAFW